MLLQILEWRKRYLHKGFLTTGVFDNGIVRNKQIIPKCELKKRTSYLIINLFGVFKTEQILIIQKQLKNMLRLFE